ncbi:hypothetical protein J5N97_013563 [Dioscorea zingiberensis]|uniref:Uncharacterized protein n=1 Tax=Dioscorea zingiberensis TaxID=325984 RepID=A0A9D5CSH3_9LILI|nr:hypothetical protein J5N97_013563 [Dioscorea zingiberensis]
MKESHQSLVVISWMSRSLAHVKSHLQEQAAKEAAVASTKKAQDALLANLPGGRLFEQPHHSGAYVIQ